MQIIITRQFAKDVEKELPKKFQLELAEIIEQIQLIDHLMEIPNLKKIKGYKTAYRIDWVIAGSVFFLKIILLNLAGL